MELPVALTHLLADAELIVTAWSAASNELVARVVKNISDETGRLTFRGVVHVSLPPALMVESMEAHPPSDLPQDFWTEAAPKLTELGDAETAFLVFGAWGGRFYVIAESIDYAVLQ